jgi:parvulin-like peptidyl-prolyl isomerase
MALATQSLAARPNVAAEPQVAARVGDEPVYAAEVDDILSGAKKDATGEDAVALRELALQQAINRRLAAQYLAREGYAVDEDETKALLADLKSKLEAQKLTFDEFLKRHRFNESMVRRRLQWDVMWAQFVQNNATDKALERFFDLHRREFDGTELRVSHILWPVKAGESDKLAAALKQAEEVRSRLLAGKLSFADAAKQFSSGPSRRNGGDLGFIPAHDVMTEPFSRAAFELKAGEVTEPVFDQFGVHLITLTDEKSGRRTWRDCRRELVAAFAREKFLELADAQRKRVEVRINDDRR